MLTNFHYVCYYVGVKSSFRHARVECESRRAYMFKVSDVQFVRTL